jgi:hypothetical protein
VQLCLTTCATVSYYLCNCVLLLVQLCLTTCATVSYYLCKCLTNSPPIDRTVLGTVLGTVLEQFSGKQPSPLMETAGKAVLPYGTVWATVSYCLASVSYCLATVSYCLATVSYCLWKWLARSFPFMETVLEVVQAKISGYIKS